MLATNHTQKARQNVGSMRCLPDKGPEPGDREAVSRAPCIKIIY